MFGRCAQLHLKQGLCRVKRIVERIPQQTIIGEMADSLHGKLHHARILKGHPRQLAQPMGQAHLVQVLAHCAI